MLIFSIVIYQGRLGLLQALLVALADYHLLLELSGGIVNFAEAQLLTWEWSTVVLLLLLMSYSTIVQTSICVLPFFTSGHLSRKGAIFPDRRCLSSLFIDSPLIDFWSLLLLLLLQRHEISVA